jgi:hypothetical protein
VIDAGASIHPTPTMVGAAPRGSVVPTCTNCGSDQVAKYCAACGERQPSRHDFSVRALATDAFHDATSIDGRLFRSIIALVARPGFLTREWFEGRRGRYVKPFSLFVLLNVAFFVIQPHTQLLGYDYDQYTYGAEGATRQAQAESRRAKMGESAEQFRTRFDAALQDQKKSLLVFCIPVLALALAVAYAGRGRYFAEHLVFSVHAYAFLLIFLGAVVPLLSVLVLRPLYMAGVPRGSLTWLQGDSGIAVMLGVVMGTYLYRALRVVYGDRPGPAIVRTILLFLVIGRLTLVYHDVLFYTTLYSL